MSKHLRFGRLLGLLAIMLTMSFAWAQGQNLSSEKVLSHFRFEAAPVNPALFGDVVGTVNEVTKVVSVVLPYRYNTGQPDAIGSTPLKASFKASKFSNVFKGQATATDLMIGSAWRTNNAIGQGYGTESNAPWILSGAAYSYFNNDVLTVEAENHSYLYYTIAMSFAPASTLNNILSMEAAWTKNTSTFCTIPGVAAGEGVVTMNGTNITIAVPYGATLNPVTLEFAVDPFTKVYTGTPLPGTAVALADPLVPNVYLLAADLTDLTNGIKINVYPQAYPTVPATTPKVYTVKAVVGIPSELDVMHQLVFTASANPALTSDVVATLDPATQTWTAVVPFGVDVNDLEPSWQISEYATMFNRNPHVAVPPAFEICSATVLAPATFSEYWFWKIFCKLITWHTGKTCAEVMAPMVEHDGTLEELFTTAGGLTNGCGSFWVQAEDPSEVSEYPFCITNAAASTAKELIAINATYVKPNTCGTDYTATVAGVVASTGSTTGTITFTLPYGVSAVSVKAPFMASTATVVNQYSYLATTTTVVGTSLINGSTVSIVDQNGAAKVYTVAIVNGAISSEKQILTFGFHAVKNTGLGFDWYGVDYAGAIDQVNKLVVVTVPYVTDLHHLTAYFTSSPYSCVSIANTNGNVPQTSDVTINDHSNTLTYVVTAENGTQERYQIMVVKEAVSSVKCISDFALLGLPYCEGVYMGKSGNGGEQGISYSTYTVDGDLVTVNGTNITISVKYGTVLTNLAYEFELCSPVSSVTASNGTAYVSTPGFSTFVWGTANFTNPVVFTVTAQDYSQTAYTVTVVPRPVNSDKVLTSFWFKTSPVNTTIGNADIHGVIDQATRVVTVHVPFGSNVSNLAAGFILNNGVNDFPGGAIMTHSEDHQYVQVSDYTTNDFRHQVAYTIWGEDCSTLEYFVNVIVDDNGGNSILNMLLSAVQYPNCETCEGPFNVASVGVMTGNNIVFTVPYGTNLHNITLTGAASPEAVFSPALNTITSYTGPITLTVTAGNGISTQTYTLTVVKEGSFTGAQLLTFGFEAENNEGVLSEDRWTVVPINQVTFRVDVKVPFGTDKTNLVASFTQSPMACVYVNGLYWTAEDLQCSGETANNFSDALTYTVKSQSGVETYYNVYVTHDAPLTEKALSVFNLTNIAYCTGLNISPATYTIAGSGTTAIAVSVKAGSSLAAVEYSFTVSPTATVTASNGTPVKVGSTVTGVANFTNPVTFTVKAQDLSTQTYVVTVTPRAVNSQKQLTKYWMVATTNSIVGGDVMGTINEAAKTVDVWVPWGTAVTSLKANFELNNNANNFAGGAIMTHSEDMQMIQTSGVSANDFTTPVAYTVIAEDCSTVEYFVTVRMTPNTDTGISGFGFTYTDCGCDLSTKIDTYARRIYITVPSTVNIASLAPTSIVVTPAIGTRPAATVSPAVGVAQNWTNGPVKYTVTAPDGVTKADWMVYVTNPPCKNTDILTFSLPNAQVTEADLVAGFGKPVVIDAVNHTIDITIKKGVNLTSVYYERTLPCGATICCVGGNCQDNHYLDFSQGGCHTCVVTAQDQTVTQEWTICVHEIDVAIPEVETWSVMAYNCTDSVAVQSNELGRVFIVNEAAINMSQTPASCIPMYNLADWTGTGATSVAKLIENRMGAWATVTAVDTPIYVKTNGLYSGMYWAFSVDASGRMSCISTQKLFLDICDVTVATLCDLRGQPDVWRYTLTQEVLVNHEEARSTGGNWKFVQTADCGILIEDRLAALPTTYGVGAGLTNLKGMLDKSGIAMKFIPVCCYTPAKTTGNVVPVKELTWNEFNTQCYSATKAFESMLVKITTPIIAKNDYDQGPNWMFDGLDLETKNATGGKTYFIQSVFNTPLIGTAIPTVPAYYTGVRTNLPWGTVIGAITPRKAADITLLTAPVITAVPNPANIDGVLPGQCKSISIKIYNEGVGNSTITALYLDDASASDEFQIVTAGTTTVPFTIGTWENKSVEVKFCPLDAGNETTNLIVEYGVGKTLVVPINGTTIRIIATLPACEDFNSWPNATGSYNGWMGVSGSTRRYGTGGFVAAIGDGYAYTITHAAGAYGSITSPGFVVPATMGDPILAFSQGKIFGAGSNSPIKVFVSKDGQATWTEIYASSIASLNEVYSAGGPWINPVVSLAAFKGETIFLKFESFRPVGQAGFYWVLENICVQERITAPIISVSPAGDFGGVQLDATATINFTVKNIGVSILKVKKVELVGSSIWSLTDTNTYPVEITGSSFAYTTGAAGTSITFAANVTPVELGVQTAKIVITYGMYDEMTLEIPLSVEGLSCSTAATAVIGQNYAPSQNSWFKFTADKFSIVEVTSCDAHQDLVTNEYAWDTYLYIYADCDGTLLGENDDMEAACVYNRASSSVTTVVNAGETIYIFWPLAFPTALYAYDGFYFNINVSYPTDGDVCENAIPLTLPVVNHFGTTVGFNDDYNMSPCSPFSNYMDGNDKVYSITIPYEGYLTGSLLGAYGSIHVLDVCPTEELEKFHCKAFTSGPTGGAGFDKKIAEGTYFVIISTWAPPQTVDFLLNLSFRGTGVEDNALNNTLTVYPNPTDGKFTVNVSNVEATDMTIELVNISGQMVYRNEVKAAYSYNEEIDATTFAKGVYYLKVSDAKGVKIEKVVIQ